MVCLTMDLKLFFSLKGFATLRARHLESCFELHILVCIHRHLLGMVWCVLFLSDFMFRCLSVFFEQLFWHEGLHTCAALVPPFLLTQLVVWTERTSTFHFFHIVIAVAPISFHTCSSLLNYPVHLVNTLLFISSLLLLLLSIIFQGIPLLLIVSISLFLRWSIIALSLYFFCKADTFRLIVVDVLVNLLSFGLPSVWLAL